MSETLRVGLDSWIIQDGNYDDFGVGDRRAFALEFCAPTPLVVYPPGEIDRPPSNRWLSGATYEVNGKVSFQAAHWWVLEAGISLYQEGVAPGPVGTQVHGEVYIGVDPFFYFERLAAEPDAPPLILDWRIDQIELDTAPLAQKPKSQPFERDRARQGWKQIDKTDAWWDDSGHAGYVLTCSRLPGQARHKL